MESETIARLAFLTVLLLALSGWFFTEFSKRMGPTLRSMAAWALIFTGIAAGYGLWGDIRYDSRPRQSQSQDQDIILRRAGDGHFYARLTISGVDVDFLVDTGASGISLTREDAGRIGFSDEDLRFDGIAQTANGQMRTARLRLKDVQFGAFHDRSLPARVMEGDAGQSLLGMDYLRFYAIRIDGNRMVLSR